MRVVYKEPGEDPRIMVIPNELKLLQTMVGGYIETITFQNAVLIINEEGRLKDLPVNFSLKDYGDIRGTVVITGYNLDEFVSLSVNDANYICGILRGGFDL